MSFLEACCIFVSPVSIWPVRDHFILVNNIAA
jgi:hypothetical protein